MLSISELAERAGLTTTTIRYYERSGLLPEPKRSAAGYRLYKPDELDRLRFIKGAQRVGLRLREVRELLEVRDRGACPCGHTAEVVGKRLAEVDAEIEELSHIRGELSRLVERIGREREPDGRPWPCDRELIQIGGR